jgi:diaminopimelate decarboxylase
MNQHVTTPTRQAPTASGLSDKQATELAARYGAPLYVYDHAMLGERAEELMALTAPYGLTVRYAVKANPHPQIIKLFAGHGLHFDASSSYEAAELIEQGIAADSISLSSQQPAHNLPELLQAGVRYVATSMRQLELFAAASQPGARVALRVNAGLGSGHSNRTTTAGVAASFGLWHEYLDDALAFAHEHTFVIDRLHTHIGSGADPAQWGKAIELALSIAARMPDVTTLDMGGGYKVHRAGDEQETNMQAIADVFGEKLTSFYHRTGRKLHLELEPGTWLVAHAGSLLAQVVDIVDTGNDGYTFLRTNTGLNDFLRPALYGAQHRMRIVNNATEQTDYVVVGHNCESGDILTPAPANPEAIMPRRLSTAQIGDILLVEDTGAYCASLRASGYNAFPGAQEILV